MGFRETVLAAQRYSDAETARQASFGLLPQVVPEFTVLEAVTLNRDGTANVLIEQGHGERLFDAPVVLFFELAIAIGSRLRLNSRGPDKAAGKDNLYPRLDIPGTPGQGSFNMQVNRIVADPAIGRRVRQNTADHRNHLREGLRTDENPLEYGPGKARTTRWDAIEAILEAYDRTNEATRSVIARAALEGLLSGLLALADGRATERQSEELGVAPTRLSYTTTPRGPS